MPTSTIDDLQTRRSMALGRVQAFASVRLEATAALVLAIRSARACGATDDELRVEAGLTRAELRRMLTQAPQGLGGGG